MKNLLIIVVFFLISCVFHEKAVQLPKSQAREPTQGYIQTFVEPVIGTENTASIGAVVLWFTKISYSAEVVLAVAAPGFDKLPPNGWEKTHEFQSMAVYTHPEFKSGHWGVVLDSSEQVVLYIQTGGVRRGIKHNVSKTPFFGRVQTIVETWRLRYSGRIQSAYKFEIFTTSEDKAIQATQSFEVSEESFLAGFVVRGVLIKGTAPGTQGTISYQILSKPNE